MLIQHSEHLQYAQRKLCKRPNRPQRTHALEPADLDELQRKSSGRNHLRFEAGARADEHALMSAPLQLARHGEQRNNVSARPAPGHYDGCHLRS